MSRTTLSVVARIVLIAGLLVTRAPSASAQTSTWVGGGASDVWGDTGNWSGTTPTNAGSSALTFGGTTRLTPNDDFTSYTATAVTFDATAGAFTLGGAALNLAGDITNNSTALQTINQNLVGDFTTSRTIAATSGSITIGGAISNGGAGTGRIIKAGNGTLTLTINNPSYSGGFSILGGALSVSNDSQLGFAITTATPGYIVINGGTLQFTGGTSLLSQRGVALGPVGAPGTGTLDVTGTTTISYNGVIANNTDGVTPGVGSLIKTGTGTFVFGGTSTYSGSTFVQNGAVRTNNNNRIPSGVMTLGTATTAGKLLLGNATNTTAVTQTLTGLVTGGMGAANSVVGGNLPATGTHTLVLNIASGTDTFDGTIGGPGAGENSIGVTKGSGGTLVLTGTNTYIGPTTINGGILQFSTLANIGNGTAIAFGGGTLQYASGNTADISGRTVTFNNAGGGGTIDTNGNNVTFANAIGNAGVGGLTKAGAGRLTLGPTNTYTGATTVAAGTLAFTGTNPAVASTSIVVGTAPASTAVLDVSAVTGGFQVASGKTLSGHGTVNGATTILSGGIVNPGTGGTGGIPAGTLSFSNGLNVSGTYGWDLITAGSPDATATGQSTATGGVHDMLAVTGLLDLTGSTLAINAPAATGFNSSSPYSWRIATYGSINNLPTTLTLSGSDFTGVPVTNFAVIGNGGNLFLNYTPVPVPEPSSILLTCAAAGVLGWWRKRRAADQLPA
jgi:autotransporter-associated beta strand protein